MYDNNNSNFCKYFIKNRLVIGSAKCQPVFFAGALLRIWRLSEKNVLVGENVTAEEDESDFGLVSLFGDNVLVDDVML